MDERRGDYPQISERLATVEERTKTICEKIDVVTKAVTSINERCFERVGDYVLFKKHLKNGESMKSLWQDRNFKVLIMLVSPIYIALIGFIIGWVNGH